MQLLFLVLCGSEQSSGFPRDPDTPRGRPPACFSEKVAQCQASAEGALAQLRAQWQDANSKEEQANREIESLRIRGQTFFQEILKSEAGIKAIDSMISPRVSWRSGEVTDTSLRWQDFPSSKKAPSFTGLVAGKIHASLHAEREQKSVRLLGLRKDHKQIFENVAAIEANRSTIRNQKNQVEAQMRPLNFEIEHGCKAKFCPDIP